MLQEQTIEKFFAPMRECLHVDDPVWKAWRVMKDRSIKCLPVANKGKVVGIVSAKDIVQISSYNGGQSMPVKEAMSLDPLVVAATESLSQVLQAMLHKEQKDAVVVNALGDVLGLFCWDTAFRIFLASMNHEKNRTGS